MQKTKIYSKLPWKFFSCVCGIIKHSCGFWSLKIGHCRWSVISLYLSCFFLVKNDIKNTTQTVSKKESPGCLRHDSSLWRPDRLLVKTHFKRSGNLPTPTSVGNKISQMTMAMSTCLITGGRGASNTFFPKWAGITGRAWKLREILGRESRIWILNHFCMTTLKGHLLYPNKLYQSKEMVTTWTWTVAAPI